MKSLISEEGFFSFIPLFFAIFDAVQCWQVNSALLLYLQKGCAVLSETFNKIRRISVLIGGAT